VSAELLTSDGHRPIAAGERTLELKGIAEPPCVPTPGAIANAIARAIGTPVLELPMTPERVFGAIASTGTEA
jgi:CO/xanthine dehydrogenase Mo-binding subunit